MPNSFTLDIITPKKSLYSGRAEMVVVRTATGEEGFMAGHAKATKLIVDGKIRVTKSAAEQPILFETSSGFINVSGTVSIFVDRGEKV